MKILMLANARAVHTMRWARALAERGHEVTVLSIRTAEIPGVRVITVAVGPRDPDGYLWPALGYLRMLATLPGLLRRLRPDLVNPHYCVTHGAIAALAGARPRVVNIWGSDVIWDGPGALPRWRRALMRLALQRADAVISTSRFMAKRTVAELRRRPPVEVVPFGVDTTLFRPAEREAPTENVTIGWVKTFRPRYAPDVFVRAAAIAARANPFLRFVMIGRGPEEAATQRLAGDLGLGERIVFGGFVPNDKLPAAMAGFDILVNSSRAESFGVVLLEGAACGLPVIATDVGGVREAVRAGETALLVRANDPDALATAMLTLADDSSLRQRLGMAGRKFVTQTYEWSGCVDRAEQILLGVAARQTGGAA